MRSWGTMPQWNPQIIASEGSGPALLVAGAAALTTGLCIGYAVGRRSAHPHPSNGHAGSGHGHMGRTWSDSSLSSLSPSAPSCELSCETLAAWHGPIAYCVLLGKLRRPPSRHVTAAGAPSPMKPGSAARTLSGEGGDMLRMAVVLRTDLPSMVSDVFRCVWGGRR